MPHRGMTYPYVRVCSATIPAVAAAGIAAPMPERLSCKALLQIEAMKNPAVRKLIALLAVAVVLLVGYIAAGPFLVVKAIRDAIKAQDTAALAEHVDFPALRGSLKAQLDDYVVRKAGADIQSNVFGAIALHIASGVTGGTVDAMITPAGLGAILEGRNLWHRASGGGISDTDSYASQAPPDPLEGARYGFESTSRFTATVTNDDGEPVTFVLARDGLRWKLNDIRLPLDDASG